MDSAESARKVFLDRIGMPAALLDNMTMAPTFTSERTVAALAGSGLTVPEFGSYSTVLWKYWRANLDPNRARRNHPKDHLSVG
jgi:hypothetical protein